MKKAYILPQTIVTATEPAPLLAGSTEAFKDDELDMTAVREGGDAGMAASRGRSGWGNDD